MNLLINLIAGLFFIIGVIISLKKDNNKELTNISLGLAFTVLMYLLIFDIAQEAYESFNNNKIIFITIGSLIGIGILKIIEKLVPHHNHYEEKSNHNNHLEHIGIMTSLALIIHNVVEGMGIYIIAQSNIKTGLICVLGVGMHNIPFGIEITALLKNINKKQMWKYITLLTLSTFIGGLLIYLFEPFLNSTIIGLLLSISMGMIIYLLFFELLTEIKETFNKYTIYGVLLGVIIMLIGELLW